MTGPGGPPAHEAEAALRRRLREEVGGTGTPGPPPADPVLLEGLALRGRRRLAVAAGLAAITAVAAVVAIVSPSPAHQDRAGDVTVNAPRPGAPGGVFASGTAAGRPWRLAVRDVADPGSRCLAAVMLNGHDGDLLPARPATPAATAMADIAFLPRDVAQPTAGFGFLLVGPGITRVGVRLPSGRALTARAVTLTACGRRVRLAGFAYPAPGVRRITAYSATGAAGTYTPPPGTFSPVLPPGVFSAGLWSNAVPEQDVAATGRAGSGRVGHLAWTVSVTLGSEGQCYIGFLSGGPGPPPRGTPGPGSAASAGDVSVPGERERAATRGAVVAAQQRAARADGPHASVECQPLQSPPRSGLYWLPIDSLTNRQVTGYAGTVSASTSFLVAELADGAHLRIRPAVIGGRKYFALVLRRGCRVERLVSYGASGRALASTASFPAPG